MGELRAYVAAQPIASQGFAELFADLGVGSLAISDGHTDVVPEIRECGAAFALLDVALPGVQVESVLRELVRDRPRPRVVFGASVPDGSVVYEALAAGAAGFVALDSPLPELRTDLARAASGSPVVSARIEQLLAGEIQVQSTAVEVEELAPRQLEILRLVADGATTQEIAEGLGISPLTVKTHFRAIYQKLEVSNKAAAIAEGFRRKILA